MSTSSITPSWEKLYDISLTCAQSKDQLEFCQRFVSLIQKIYPFEQAAVFFFDANSHLENTLLFHISEDQLPDYIRYYCGESPEHTFCCSWSLESRYSRLYEVRWDYDANRDEDSHSVPFQVSSTVVLRFAADVGKTRTVVVLDRMKHMEFTEQEKTDFERLLPMLEALHRHVLPKSMGHEFENALRRQENIITPREIEVAVMLCQGVSPANISKELYIAESTVRKHICHIYAKMKVSNQRELLAKVMEIAAED